MAEMASEPIALAAVAEAKPMEAVLPAHWSLAKRVGFRLCFVYFILYVLSNQMLGGILPFINFIKPLEEMKSVQVFIGWAAKHLFHIGYPLVTMETGSGDRTFDWVMNFCLLALAIIAAVVWSVVDRKRENYSSIYKWFRVFVRFALAAQMFGYGFAKMFPLQMPFPRLERLLEPYGNFSPMGVLWSSIGASQAYEIFAGCAETAGGFFLIFPRTATFGALICLADMTQVFLLNMTYDVPVKLLSFNLILFSLFLIAGDADRLANVFFLNRTAPPEKPRPLFRRAWANRTAVAVQIAFGFVLIGMTVYGRVQEISQYGWKAPKPALYGIWNVEDFSIDGQERPPVLTDTQRWRRLVFDSFGTMMVSGTVYGMDDTSQRYALQINTTAKTFVLTKQNDKNWKATFAFQRATPTELVVDGTMDNHKIHAQLAQFDVSKFLLVSRGFHWVQERGMNR
ncbi:MAG: hypothetical protein WBE86_03695 [Candidatus Acidiferrales bacterium]